MRLKEKTARKLNWFCSPFNVPAILDQLVRNAEHVL